ncbi:MAG: PEGA domain-containing protein, partial [Candidatus Cloacimonetes bacterium]|nr:PEGA domain-containing protein [Candidatus Cloacimonadota bacterium]
MKRILGLFLFTMFVVIVSALQFKVVENPKEVPMHAGFVNLPDNDRYDRNGNLCGMLIVRSGIKNLNIDSPMKHRQIEKNGEYWVILQDGCWYVDIKKVDYAPLEINFRESITKIDAGKVYEVTIDALTPEAGDLINISIISDPEDAEKWLDGKLLGTGKGFTVKKGTHQLELKKNGFKSQSRDINVSKDNFTFGTYSLSGIEPVKVTIKSVPDGADIYINNINEGKTNLQPFYFPGSYNLRLVKDKYDTVEETITVTENGKNEFSFTLTKNTSLLTISTTPSDCEIYINKSKVTGTSKEVSAGTYQIEVKKEGYISDTRTVVVQKGMNKTESFTLVQITGKLQFVVAPMEASVTLKSGTKTIESWTGSNYLKSVPIGTYKLEVTCNGYKSDSQDVTVKADETENVRVTLETGATKPANTFSSSGSIAMVFVDGGTFQMGSNSGESDEKPVHSVTVSDFYIGKYEITQKEWQSVMRNNPSNFKGDTNPVEKVSWYDVV